MHMKGNYLLPKQNKRERAAVYAEDFEGYRTGIFMEVELLNICQRKWK